MHLDLSCPLELLGYDLTHNEQGVRGFVRLWNLSDAPVTGFEAVITWQGENGAADIPLSSGAIFAPPHDAFVLPIETDSAPSGHWSGLFFVRVDFQSAALWHGNPRRLIDVEMPEKPSKREMKALRRAAGPDAAVRPLDAGGYWVCACGRANPRKSIGCDRCGRTKRDCLRLSRQLAEVFDGKAPEGKPANAKRKAAARPAAEGELPFHKALERRYLRQRSLLIRRTVTMLTAAGLIALIALAWTWLIGMQQRAKDIVPPMKIDQAAQTQETSAP